MAKLNNKTIAILATDGFEESELFSPKEALEKEGAQVHIVSLEEGDIQAFRGMKKGRTISVDKTLENADINAYDGLVIPGGLYNPDALRRDEKALAFARNAFAKRLPVASICHGPQVLISADLVEGRKMTGYSAIQIDLKNAGAEVVDEEVVVDSGLVTSRNPDDLPAFNRKMIEEFCEGEHVKQEQQVA